MEQWIPGKPGTRYPPSLQIDMPQPSQLPRGAPTLPTGMCLSISNEAVAVVSFIASPKMACLVRYCLRLASSGLLRIYQDCAFAKRTISQDESQLQNPLQSYRILGSRPFRRAIFSESRVSLPSTKITEERSPDGVTSTVLFRTGSYS